ncbi:hypothetical protein GGR54DRAFT_644140 [Hypoxylon sp. NC1633]|nr:hypothetical protein GGR54DRAFT_644140 [Hypoxylon sp. NC1633]
MDEIEKLKRLLKDEKRRREEEQRLYELAENHAAEQQHRREEKQRRREEAEALNKKAQAQTLPQYLESYHSLSLAIRKKLLDNPSFFSDAIFPSFHQLEYVASVISPISSEIDLRQYKRDTVENAVKKLVDRAYKSSTLQKSLDLRRPVTFESHTNLGDNNNPSISFKHLTIGGEDKSAPNPAVLRAFRRARMSKVGPANQFCIYRTSDGRNIPALTIEYKASHKLTMDEVVTGLQSKI